MLGGGVMKIVRDYFIRSVYCSPWNGSDNGFGSQYVWAGSLESGIQIGANHRKPVMVIIHKSWCPACKKLKPKFAESQEIQSLSKHFVMVNVIDDQEPSSRDYSPDGNYIPRILFVSPNGYVDLTIYNEDGTLQYKYFYSRPEQIAKSMRKAIEKYRLE
ncbi:Thioredoxin domain-containing protein 12 [Eumeta japonica]|uniref:Thioredoxin domain-containing protein 12 n=1 Tax=Eumeta variegata TaxID=151549 RepID=A0A4C1XAP4_EUMVA|nr:Thioredoxin domain-containing protein 12 [Eumeta japonica]